MLFVRWIVINKKFAWKLDFSVEFDFDDTIFSKFYFFRYYGTSVATLIIFDSAILFSHELIQ